MKQILITNLEELKNLDLTSYEVNDDTDIEIKLRLTDQELEYPINISHFAPKFSSNINIRIALFGKSKVKMPVHIQVNPGARDCATHFKALVYVMSKDSHAHVTPGLFIHEKNIQGASHGVVIKNIKDKDLYYLRSRGLNRQEAKDLIVNF